MNTPEMQQRPRDFHIQIGEVRQMITEIERCDYADRDNGHQNEMHLHHYHQMDIVLDGEFTLTFENNRDQTGHIGDAWIIPPLVAHGVSCTKAYRFCSFKFYLTPQFWTYFGNDFVYFSISNHLRKCVDEMAQRNYILTSHTAEYVAAVASLCLTEYMNQHSPPAAKEGMLYDFRQELWPLLEKIQLAPSIRWTVTRMAEEIGLSPDHFTRCFRQVLGKTPQQYVSQAAMRGAAANLVKTPSIPIKEIANRAGYADVHSFSHAFKRIFKTSPVVYKVQQRTRVLDE